MKKIDNKISSHLSNSKKSAYNINPYRIKSKCSPLGIWVQAWTRSTHNKKLKDLSGRITPLKS